MRKLMFGVIALLVVLLLVAVVPQCFGAEECKVLPIEWIAHFECGFAGYNIVDLETNTLIAEDILKNGDRFTFDFKCGGMYKFVSLYADDAGNMYPMEITFIADCSKGCTKATFNLLSPGEATCEGEKGKEVEA